MTAPSILDVIYMPAKLPEVPEYPVLSTGWPELDPHLKIRQGEFIVITGVPGCGKSLFTKALSVQMARKHTWKIGIASFEEPLATVRRILGEMWLGKRAASFTDDEHAQATKLVNLYWRLVSFNHQKSEQPLDPNLQNMLAVIETLAAEHCHMVVVDPWNEMDHYRLRDETVTEYTGRAIKALKQYAMELGVTIVVVAHPTKMRADDKVSLYSISDSAHWANKSDVGIIVTRDAERLEIKIAKIRSEEDIGRPGTVHLAFNTHRRRFECVPKELWRRKRG